MTRVLHEVVEYRGRDICSCGDQRCSSLGYHPRKVIGMAVTTIKKREAVLAAFPSKKWRDKVDKMSDKQVIAVYFRLKEQQKI